ncbi:Succinyl-CoA:(R)-benzylsuccinate CoA-transferase subunit BbsF [compost metagenome]
MLAQRIPCAPVRSLGEVMQDKHMHERGMLQTIEHPELGEVVLPHSPLRFESAPLTPLRSSSPLGQENHEVIVKWLGRSDDEFKALVDSQVI